MIDNVHISVRSLVEYIYRSGSIESGFRTSTSLTEGTKAHQKVQQSYNGQDQREVYVSAEVEHQGLLFVIALMAAATACWSMTRDLRSMKLSRPPPTLG